MELISLEAWGWVYDVSAAVIYIVTASEMWREYQREGRL